MRGAETLETLCSRITSCYARVRRRPHRTNAVVQFFYGSPSCIPDARAATARADGISSLFRERASRASEPTSALYSAYIYIYINTCTYIEFASSCHAHGDVHRATRFQTGDEVTQRPDAFVLSHDRAALKASEYLTPCVQVYCSRVDELSPDLPASRKFRSPRRRNENAGGTNAAIARGWNLMFEQCGNSRRIVRTMLPNSRDLEVNANAKRYIEPRSGQKRSSLIRVSSIRISTRNIRPMPCR